MKKENKGYGDSLDKKARKALGKGLSSLVD